MMKIGIELQPLLHRKTGIGWYNYNLIQAMTQKEASLEGLLFNFLSRNREETALEALGLSGIEVNHWMPYGLYRRIWSFIPLGYQQMFRKRYEIYHFLNYIVPPVVKGRVVLNIYDMVYKRFPETMHEKTLQNLEKHLIDLKNRVDCIVTISEFSKSEILALTDFDASRIEVVYPGVDMDRYSQRFDEKDKEERLEMYGISRPFFLYVGTIEPRKNLDLVIQAYREFIMKNGPTHQLVLVGMKGWGMADLTEKLDWIKDTGEVILTGYVPEEDKIMLYQESVGFVFPSLYEGFGMPAIEAMAASTPVILSDIPVFREIAGEAALFVDPHDPQALFSEMDRLVRHPKTREQMVEKGLVRIESFTWEKAAGRMVEIYRQLGKSEEER